MSQSYQGLTVSALSKTVPEGIESLSITEWPQQQLPEQSLRIKTYCTALNFFDLLLLVGKYQYKPTPPFIIGSECSGVVTEVGKGVKRFKVGDPVICGMSTATGASQVICHENFAVPKPASFSYAQAAGFFVGFTTAYQGLVQRAHLKKDEWLLITGAAGGMGIAAIQLGKLLGAKIICLVSSQDKADFCLRAGADHTVVWGKEKLKDRVAEITKGRLCDVIYEIVGGDVFHECVRCVAQNGGARLCVIGFASGNIPKLPANLALIKGFSLVGVRAGEEMRRNPHLVVEMYQSLAQWTAEGKIQQLAPVLDKVIDIKDFKDGFNLINDRQVRGKVVLSWESLQSKL